MSNRNYGLGRDKMSQLISTYFSDNQLLTAMVFNRGDLGYRVCCLDSYFGTEKEFFFDQLQEAEDFAEDWVL